MFNNPCLCLCIANRPTCVWSSGNDIAKKGVFIWANNGAPVKQFYPSNTATGQPDGEGDCISLQLRLNGTLWPMHVMSVHNCADKAAFICKSPFVRAKPPAKLQQQQPTPSRQSCQRSKTTMDSYFVDDGAGFRYFVSQTKANWYGAISYCEDLCAELISFDSEREYEFLKELARLRRKIFNIFNWFKQNIKFVLPSRRFSIFLDGGHAAAGCERQSRFREWHFHLGNYGATGDPVLPNRLFRAE